MFIVLIFVFFKLFIVFCKFFIFLLNICDDESIVRLNLVDLSIFKVFFGVLYFLYVEMGILLEIILLNLKILMFV